MRTIAALALCWLLAGCVSLSPLSSDGVTALKAAPTAVLFSDDVGQVDYLEDHYYVLAVTQTSSNSVYKTLWDSGKDLSGTATAGLSALGVKATSAYDLLQGQDVAALKGNAGSKFAFEPNRMSLKKETTQLPAVAPALRDALVAKGQEYLIWSNWSGLLLHIQTLGLPARLSSNLAYRVVDLKKNEVIGGGLMNYNLAMDLTDKTGKDVMEKDNLAGLKAHAQAVIQSGFVETEGATVVGLTTGLQTKAKTQAKDTARAQ